MLTSEPKKNLVLIVDDVEQNVTVLSQVLRDAGMNVIAAFSGEQALRLVEKRLPDLILLDVMMPGMDGILTCKELKQRERTADIPVIFLSALSETDTKVRGLESGAVDYVAKPFNEREVVARVSVHLTIRNLQQERTEHIRQLERLNNEKDRLVRILSHDLRSPLGGINGLATILRDTDEAKNETSVRHFSKVICQSSEHLLALVNDLLDLAAIESGSIALNPQNYDIVDELRSLTELLTYMAATKGITLTLDVDKESYPVTADKPKITQVVNNIVTNAIKFTKEGGVTLAVSTIEIGGERQLIFKVKDTGIGISKENMEIL
ncbi:MAG: response regulator, partial [Candidatus Kapabacteria bacterium]|nr:response regulator [Candidatus Kapabacteria bacterium]